MTKQILIIDDDPINNLILRKELEKKGHSIELVIFEDALKAMRFIEDANQLPSLILLDINMPEMSGWEFLKQLEANKMDITVFMITSSVVKRDQEKATNFSLIKDYLIKPLSAQDFDKIVKTVS